MKYISTVLICIFLFSCEEHDYYTIASPNKDKCLTIDNVTSLRPEFKSYVKIYYGSGEINKKEYVKMRWDNFSGFAVNWGVSPIVITNGLVLENTISNHLIKYQMKMTLKDDSLFHKSGSLWRSYDFVLITNGEYESCK
jgi:hypothetical protein